MVRWYFALHCCFGNETCIKLESIFVLFVLETIGQFLSCEKDTFKLLFDISFWPHLKKFGITIVMPEFNIELLSLSSITSI